MPEASVAIPVRNGGELFAGVLDALAAQTVAHELLVCDSGSNDGSVALAHARGARVLEIAPERFSHGGTRNLLMDARDRRARRAAHARLPAGRRALAGAHARRLRARAPTWRSCSAPTAPVPTRPRRCAWSSNAGSARSPPTGALSSSGWQRTSARCRRSSWWGGEASSPTPTPAWRGRRGSACRSARFPTRRIACSRSTCSAPATPRRICRRPRSSTLTTYTAGEQLRRCFDEWRGLLEVYGWREPAAPAHLLAQLRGELARTREDLVEQGVPPRRRRTTLAAVARHHVVCRAGALLGSRADRLPATARGRLSLEGRAGYTPLDLDGERTPPPSTLPSDER